MSHRIYISHTYAKHFAIIFGGIGFGLSFYRFFILLYFNSLSLYCKKKNSYPYVSSLFYYNILQKTKLSVAHCQFQLKKKRKKKCSIQIMKCLDLKYSSKCLSKCNVLFLFYIFSNVYYTHKCTHNRICKCIFIIVFCAFFGTRQVIRYDNRPRANESRFFIFIFFSKSFCYCCCVEAQRNHITFIDYVNCLNKQMEIRFE